MEIAALVIGSITLVAAITAVVFSVLSWKGGQRAERRDIERNDVSWRIDHPEDGTLVLTNVGRDAACHVLAVVTVNGETSRAEAERISSDESIEIPSKGAAAAHEEAERNDEMERRAAQDTRFFVPTVTAKLHLGESERRSHLGCPLRAGRAVGRRTAMGPVTCCRSSAWATQLADPESGGLTFETVVVIVNTPRWVVVRRVFRDELERVDRIR